MPPVVKLVRLHAAAGHRDELLQALEPVRAASGSGGTETWIIHSDRADPDRLFIYERYPDESAAQAHDALPALKEALSQVGQHLADPPEVIHAEIIATAD